MGCSRADFRLPRGFRPAVPSSFDAVRGKVFHFVYHFSVFAMRVAAVLICTLPAENYHAAVLAPQPSVLAWAVVVAAPSRVALWVKLRAFPECDDVIRRAHVSRRRGQQVRLPRPRGC